MAWLIHALRTLWILLVGSPPPVVIAATRPRPRRAVARYGQVELTDRRGRVRVFPRMGDLSHDAGGMGLDWQAVGGDVRAAIEREKANQRR